MAGNEAELRARRGGRALIVLLGVILVLVALVAWANTTAHRSPVSVPTGTLGIVAVTPDGGFAIMVDLPGRSGVLPWIISNDGGATWAKTSGKPSIDYHSSQVLECADDGTCYLSHIRSKDGKTLQAIERVDPDHTWKTEATFAGGCGADMLTVDAKDSTRAIVRCGGTTIAYRAAGGTWHLIDVATALR